MLNWYEKLNFLKSIKINNIKQNSRLANPKKKNERVMFIISSFLHPKKIVIQYNNIQIISAKNIIIKILK